MKVNVPASPLPTPVPRANWTPEFLDSMRLIRDPETDDIMRVIFEKGGEPALDALKPYLYHWNIPVDDAIPPSIRDFMAKSVNYPAFLDFEKIKLAEDLFLAYGPVSTVVLVLNAVPRFFTNPAGARSFFLAKIFSPDSVKIRMREVPQFVINIAQRAGLKESKQPDGSVTKGPGIMSAQKLRLAHARIRIKLKLQKAPNNWNTPTLGEPINQEDLAEALMHFAMSTVDGLELVGIHQTATERAATLEAWRAVGYLLGLVPEMQPTNVAEALWLRDTIMKRHMAKTMEAGALINEMLVIIAAFLPRFYRKLPAALMRNQLGDEIADMVSVPNPRLLVWFFRITRALWEDETLFARLAEKISPYLVNWLIKNPIGESTVTAVDIPPALQRSWSMPRRVS
jgi:hypothetical protein